MIQNEQNRLDPNLLQASIQGPLNFTHNLSVIFYASFCFPVPKPGSCVLGFCYCSALFLVPQSAPAAFSYVTNHYKTSQLTTTTWAVLGGSSWSLFPAVSAVVVSLANIISLCHLRNRCSRKRQEAIHYFEGCSPLCP